MARRAQFALYSCMFMVMAGFGIILPTMPFLARDLGASAVDVGLAVTLFALGQFISAPFWGVVSDRVGRRPVIVLGMAGYALSFVVMGLAQSMAGLLWGRALGGLLSGSTMPAVMASVADVTPPEGRTAAMGAIGAAANLGFVCGPLLGGMLAPLGVRAGFFASAALVCITGIWCQLMLPRRAAGGEPSQSFVRLSDFKHALGGPAAPFLWLTAALTLGGSSMFSILPYYMIARMAGSSLDAGLVFMLMGAASAAVQGWAVGPLAAKLGPRAVVVAGFLVGCAGFAGVSVSPHVAPLAITAMFVSGGMSLVRPTITAAISAVARSGQGLALGVQSSFDSLGRIIGPVLAGALFTLSIYAPYVAAAAIYASGAAVGVLLAAKAHAPTTRAGG